MSWNYRELARALHVSGLQLHELLLVTLETPEHVRGLRALAQDASLWAFVPGSVNEALKMPTLQMEFLGGTRDDVFAMLLEETENLQHPWNRNLSQQMTALDLVKQALKHSMEERHRRDADLGLKIRAKNRTIAEKRGVRIRTKGAQGDRAIRQAVVEYRREHPYKEADVIDIPTWRQIQRFADLRNLCGHNKDREPTKDEVRELIDGAAKLIKTLF